MSDGIEIEGFDELIAELGEIAKSTPASAKTAFMNGAKQTMKASQDMCPVDTHRLEEAHQLEVMRSDDVIQVDIFVGGEVDGKNVDKYAMIMHEFLQPFGAPSHPLFTLGPLSQEKDASNPSGRRVGGKFLERAVDEMEPKIIQALADAMPGEK